MGFSTIKLNLKDCPDIINLISTLVTNDWNLFLEICGREPYVDSIVK